MADFQSQQQQLMLLQQSYIKHLPDRLEEIEGLCHRLLQPRWSLDTLQQLHLAVHRLCGSSGTFGLDELSKVAFAFDAFISAAIAAGGESNAERRSQLQMLLKSLKQASTGLPDVAPADSGTNLFSPQEQPSHLLHNRLIFCVDDDLELCQDLARQISYFGYTVQSFSTLDAFQEAVRQTSPAAVIMDIMFPSGELAGADAIADMQRGREPPIPVLFISARDDLQARLQAVRAGGSAYLTKPLNISELLDQLDTLTTSQSSDPYRVLIIEDDLPLATYYALILQQSDILTEVVTDPMQAMPALIEFRPELILIDVYMPGCTGIELAAVIRQQGGYVGIPIVFLSTETDIEQQLLAIRLGGDDFLTKPIQPHHLIAAIRPRLQRSRVVRSLMERDSLTGLLNHTKIKEQLAIELQRAIRQNSSLVFAMLDIDRFKTVNDTYGHLAGDRVLKNLSLLLQQRLRKADIIGRYGGEEFAVILPNTNGQAAQHVLDEIRSGFAQVRQRLDRGEFSVTFSCGVACFPHYRDITKLSNAADRALYEAKRQGRNRVVLASD